VSGPQLQVLRPVVVLHPVLVVDLLVREERTAKYLTHHQDMLEDVSVLSRVGMSSGRLDVDMALRIIPPEPESCADRLEGPSPLELRHVAATEPVSGMLVVAARKLAGRLPNSERSSGDPVIPTR
jgi:hypothetical protein